MVMAAAEAMVFASQWMLQQMMTSSNQFGFGKIREPKIKGQASGLLRSKVPFVYG